MYFGLYSGMIVKNLNHTVDDRLEISYSLKKGIENATDINTLKISNSPR